MIGVAVNPNERGAAAEFFELFKTPWEFFRAEGTYDVVICTQDSTPSTSARLVLRFGSRLTEFDVQNHVPLKPRSAGTTILHNGRRMVLHGTAATFPTSRFAGLKDAETQEALIFSNGSNDRMALRIGYDLFQEAEQLLTAGQPAANSESATLELHIRLLRELILTAGIPVVEIPPVPQRHPFMVCLTHDIDHPVLKNHWADHTMFGFLYRATVGTLVNVCRGRKSAMDLWQNWTAALKLPLVYLGVAQDFWRRFDRYIEMEAGLGSTYFVIPRKGDAGQPLNGHSATRRASRYDVADVESELKKIISSGGEVGLHGIDAWTDGARARAERECVTQVAGATGNGVRMHWLFFDKTSPTVLDKAGFDYDSTVGYGETVGFRAGTAQAFKPLNVENLLELPLHVMDTALFYPCYLNLSEADAKKKVNQLIEETEQFGGALTINWHDRSIAPERLWEDFYVELLAELKRRGAWFPTAAQAVAWFRKRRSATVEMETDATGLIRLKAAVSANDTLPGLRVRVHKPVPRNSTGPVSSLASTHFVDLMLKDKIEVEIKL